MKNYGITGLIWVPEVSGWIHIEEGEPIAIYNHPMDFCNRISIASEYYNTELWEKAIKSVRSSQKYL